VPAEQREQIELWLPPALTSVAAPVLAVVGYEPVDGSAPHAAEPDAVVWSGGQNSR
jgi:hypothetical protein